MTTKKAQTQNMALCLKALMECREAEDGLPRLGLFYGPSGYGKSVAAAFCTATSGAAYVEAQSTWTQRAFLEAVARELGLVRLERVLHNLSRQIIETLLAEPRPIIIDEMDYIVKRGYVDLIRDFHDAAGVPILMIGEEQMPALLRKWERVDNRVLIRVAAQPCSQADARALRDVYCRKVSVADDLVGYFVERCKGVTRRVVTNIVNAQRYAIEDNTLMADRAWWGDRPVITNDMPALRRLAA